jgi:hypothetical protein
MLYSDCMAITAAGVLVYIGHKGDLYDIVGGKDGQINLKESG